MRAWYAASPAARKVNSEGKKLYRARHAEKVLAEKKAWYRANKEALLAIQKARREADPNPNKERCKTYHAARRAQVRETSRKWREKNAEIKALADKRWREANPGKAALTRAQRKARVRRPVAWADKELMADIYAYARVVRECGIDCHVDHNVPLKGKSVSGLHVHTNLTVLPARINLQKGDRFESEWVIESRRLVRETAEASLTPSPSSRATFIQLSGVIQ